MDCIALSLYYVCYQSISQLRPLRQVIQYLDSSIDHSYNQKCGLYCIELILEVMVDLRTRVVGGGGPEGGGGRAVSLSLLHHMV